MLNAEVEQFLTNYYTVLAKGQNFDDLFEDSTLSIAKENEEEKIYTSNFVRAFNTYHKKKIAKVLIVSLNVINEHYFMIIGQYVYDDSEIVRFVEVIKREGEKVKSSTVRILDEEVNYMKDKRELMNTLVSTPKKSVLVKNGGRLSYKDVISNFGSFGKIVAYEKRITDAYLEFDSYEAVENLKNNTALLHERGIEIDTYKHYEKRH